MALAGGDPVLEVTEWAFYADGTEGGSVIIGSAKDNPTLAVDTIYFVRFGLEETAGNSAMNQTAQLQYNYESGGWVNVDGSSAVVQSVATGNIADGADTTQRITSFSFDGSNEGFDEVDGVAGGNMADISSNGYETLHSFQILSGAVSDAETIVLKIVNPLDSNNDFTTYNQVDPTITVDEGVDPNVTINIASEMTSTATMYAETITADALFDVAAEMTSTATMYAETVTADALFSIAAEMTSVATMYAETVTADALFTIASAMTSLATVYEETVTAESPDVTINIAAVMTSVATMYADTTTADCNITVGVMTAGALMNSPTITADAFKQLSVMSAGALINVVIVTAEGDGEPGTVIIPLIPTMPTFGIEKLQ
jgi:hypothetical protein